MSRTKHVARVGTTGLGSTESAAALVEYDGTGQTTTALDTNVQDAIDGLDVAVAAIPAPVTTLADTAITADFASTGSNYLDAAATSHAADVALDTQVKVNADAISGGALSVDELAAVTGAAAPSAANVFATMADAGGGSGAVLESVTVETGSIATTASKNFNIDIASSHILIVGATITRTVGDTIGVDVATYDKDDFSDAYSAIFGSADGYGDAQAIAAAPIEGPSYIESGSAIQRILPYIDVDGTSELHLQVKNTDPNASGNAAEFTLVLRYFDVS